MIMIIINFLEALFSAAIYAVCAVIFWRTTPENLPEREKLCRSKVIGIILTIPAALQCVPLAYPVSPGFLLPYLLPLAIVLPVLCYFYIDFYAARALALWMIVSAYGMIHTAFDGDHAGREVVTVMCWLAGIAGIWISAKPYLLRDYFRSAAVKKWFRLLCVISAIIMMLAALSTAVQTMR